MADFKRIIVSGRLGGDVEQKDGYSDFSLASNDWDASSKSEKPVWFKVYMRGDVGSRIKSHLKKGSGVIVTGKLIAKGYIDKSGEPQAGLSISATDVDFFGSSNKSKDSQPANNSKPQSPAPAGVLDDIPF